MLIFRHIATIMMLTLLGGLSWSGWTPISFGKNLATAQDRYQKGDLKGAESAAKKALESPISRLERAKVLKVLGLVHYLSGNKSGATKAFEQALALDRTLTIQPQEALDPGAITLFQGLKSKSRRGGSPSPSPVSGAKVQKPIAGGAPLKKTLLKVISNVPSAQVSVDGILAGTTNELINVEPGKIEVEVTAPGYPSRKASVSITRDSENTITINLEKPKPKSPPPMVAQRTAAARTGGKKPPPRRSLPREEDLFAPTPSDFSEGQAGARSAKKGGLPPGDVGGDPAAAFEEEARMGLTPPAPRMPGVATAPGGGGYPPAQQQIPMAPQPQQQQFTPGFGMAPPPAPIIQQPVYVQPPIIYQTPIYQPQMYYPPPSSYSQPPPPPPDPYSTGAAPDPGPPDPSYKTESSKAKNELTFVTILPYGIGQFSQERYILAGVFAGGGAAAFAYYLYLQNDIESLKKDLALAQRENCNPAKNDLDEKTRNACNAWLADQKKDIADNVNMANMALIGGIGIGMISSLEAVMWEPEAKGSGGSKKRKNRSRRYKGFSLEFPELRHDRKSITGFVDLEPLTLLVRDPSQNTEIIGPQITIGASF